MTLDTAIVLAAIVLALVWPAHQQLTIRALRYSLARQRDQLHKHTKAIIQLQSTVAGQPTRTHEHMPVVTKVTATISGDAYLQPHTTYDGQRCAQDPDLTLRLQRPPSILPAPEPATDIEQVLTSATRPLTRNEIAGHLDRPGWELIPELAALIKAGKIAPTQGHSLDLAYRLVPGHGDTVRLAKMPVLPGVWP